MASTVEPKSYTSAGGGEVRFDTHPATLVSTLMSFMFEEGSRSTHSGIRIRGPDLHQRPPKWMEEKNVAIDGTPLTEVERNDAAFWQRKYARELASAEAIQAVKQQRRMETTHDIIGSVAWLRRKLGLMDALDDRQAATAAHRAFDRRERERRDEGCGDDDALRGGVAPGGGGEGDGGGGRRADPVLRADEARDEDIRWLQEEASRRREWRTGAAAAWEALVASIDSNRPMAVVAREYRPKLDFYGLDPFLDSAPSLIWFSTKCGIALGLCQGTVKAYQAINVDVQFLKASGVGILSILNMSVFAGVVKWGGNMALFSTAFCIGDRLARVGKRMLLPAHDADNRSPVNYVVGLALSCSTVGILPWWILNDTALAARLAVSGLFVGGMLGLCVGVLLDRLIALNLTRLDATNRHLRRYEALMKRQREWAAGQLQHHRDNSYVWW